MLEVSLNSQASTAKSFAAVVIVVEATVCDFVTKYVPVSPVVPVTCEMIAVSAVTPVPAIVAPG